MQSMAGNRIRGVRQTLSPGYVVGRAANLTKGPAQAVRMIDVLKQSGGFAALVQAHDGTIKGTPVEIDDADVTDLSLLQFINANGDWEFKSLSQVLDSVLGTTQGSIIYRNSTVWTTLAPSTVGFVLSTNGAGANPSWIAQSGGSGSAGMLPLVSGDLPGPSLIADGSGQCIGVPL
jgi:hypothetical protein